MSSPLYAAATARADKLLEPDGSVETHSGTVVSGPSAAGAAAYSSAVARADKLLQPDGSVVTSGSGTGGSTPPGGASGQLQYNNAGAFAGTTNITTDGTNITLASAAVANINGFGGSSLRFEATMMDVVQPGTTQQFSFRFGGGGYYGGSFTYQGLGIAAQPGGGGGYQYKVANLANLDLGSLPATSGTNYSSAQQNFTGSFWNASSAAQADYWTIKNVIGTGTTPTATLAIGHAGSTGVASIQFPVAAVPVFANNAAALAGGLTAGCHYRTGADPDQLCIVH